MVESATNLNFIGSLFLAAIAILLFYLPRRLAAIPFFIIGVYMTFGQRIVILDFNIYVLRIVILLGWLKVFLDRERDPIQFNSLDNVIILWILAHSLIFIMREQTFSALKYQLGFIYNTAGLYFLFRNFVVDFENFKDNLKWFAVIVIPLGIFFIIESVTENNLFSVFGGVSEQAIIREGRLRCQGPFRHPILAGTFAATAIPLFFSMWWNGDNRLLSILAICSCLTVAITSASTGPLMAVAGGLMALGAWKLRRHMRYVRWGIGLGVLMLHLYMKAPVWYIFSRIGDLAGGGGWHRSELINKAIANFDTWWFAGTSFAKTAEWFPYTVAIGGSESADFTNQFVEEAITGGVLTLSLFISILVLCYKFLGRSLIRFDDNESVSKYLWCLGACLFAHMISFFSVSYFDQIIVYWYWMMAAIAGTSAYEEAPAEEAPRPAEATA